MLNKIKQNFRGKFLLLGIFLAVFLSLFFSLKTISREVARECYECRGARPMCLELEERRFPVSTASAQFDPANFVDSEWECYSIKAGKDYGERRDCRALYGVLADYSDLLIKYPLLVSFLGIAVALVVLLVELARIIKTKRFNRIFKSAILLFFVVVVSLGSYFFFYLINLVGGYC